MRSFSVAIVTAVAGLVLNHSVLKAQPPPAGRCPSEPCKVCVSQPRQNTRKVYTCKSEEYCLPRCGWLSLLHGRCACGEGPCGDLKVRHRLVVKKVPDCDTKQCVPQQVPVIGPTVCAPAAPR